ncbi:MAG: hypothetical protein VW948_02230 [Burkholderiaceae bacterium]|jgi:hypothetical protein
MWISLSALFFLIAVADISLGSFGVVDFLDDVGEMLFLFLTTIFFVIHILKIEASSQVDAKTNQKRE